MLLPRALECALRVCSSARSSSLHRSLQLRLLAGNCVRRRVSIGRGLALQFFKGRRELSDLVCCICAGASGGISEAGVERGALNFRVGLERRQI